MRPPVIIGGGPAGATAAIALRKAGQPVTLIERSAGPTDKVCGDFLGAAAVRLADTMGIPLASLGARTVTHLRVIRRGNVVESRLPFHAVGLSRRTFDEALLRQCLANGVDLIRGETARPPRTDGQDFVIDTAQRGTLTTGTVFLATGRPDSRTILPAPSPSGVTGYKMYLRLANEHRDALAGLVEMVVFPSGQAALQRVEDDQVALCLLLRRRPPDDSWDTLRLVIAARSPHLARRLEGSVPLLDPPLVAADVPLGYLHRVRATDHDGLYRIGDQAAVLSSLIADGVSVAMRGASRAAQSWLSGAGAMDYHRRVRSMLWPRVRMVAEYDPGAPGPDASEDGAGAGAGSVNGAGMDPPEPRHPAPPAGPKTVSRLSARWNRLIA
jgi:flavin-dependent dehydrogenase